MLDVLLRLLGLRRGVRAADALDELVAALAPVFREHGYTWGDAARGTGSGGDFASGYFTGPGGRVGLMARDVQGLASIGYASAAGAVDHDTLMRAIGRADDAWLGFADADWRPTLRGGDTLTAALAHDLAIALPALAAPGTLERIVRDVRAVGPAPSAT